MSLKLQDSSEIFVIDAVLCCQMVEKVVMVLLFMIPEERKFCVRIVFDDNRIFSDIK